MILPSVLSATQDYEQHKSFLRQAPFLQQGAYAKFKRDGWFVILDRSADAGMLWDEV